MEALVFLVVALAVAYAALKWVFNRSVQRVRRKDQSKRRMRTLVFREPKEVPPGVTPSPDKRNGSESSDLSVKPPKPSEPPLVETLEFSEDWYIDQANSGKTCGEIFGMMFPQTLVDGKQCWEILENNPESKHDLNLMLACCRAQMEQSQIELTAPAPAYFRRVAIILRKQKDYARDIGIIELYWRLCDRVLEEKENRGRIREERLEARLSALKADFQPRYDKAKLLLEKQMQKAKKE